MPILASLLFCFAGVAFVTMGLRVFFNRRENLEANPAGNGFLILVAGIVPVLCGVSMIAAAFLLASQWKLALVLGLWPVLLIPTLFVTRILTVSSHLSKCEEEDC